jgi:transposase
MKSATAPTAGLLEENETLRLAVLARDRVLIEQASQLAEQASKLEELSVVISRLTERIAELEKQAGKTSANSSKPPSTDGFKKVIQNNREKTERKAGGQKGHKGHTLKYAEGDAVSERIYLPVIGACECGLDLSVSGKALRYERRQIIELPPLQAVITEYQVEQKRCVCGKVHRAACILPHAIQYGSSVQAAASYFQNRQLIPVERTQEILSDLFGLSNVSSGTVLAASSVGFGRLADWEAEQIAFLQTAPVVHVDETGMHINGKREWGHVCSTTEITLYQQHAKRGKDAHVDHLIIPNYAGVLVHDRYSTYNAYPCAHALCNAHLFRDLKGVISDKTPASLWAVAMYALINEVHQDKHTAESLEQAYSDILAAGFETNPQPIRTPGKRGKVAKSDSLNLIECYRDRKDDILRFFYDKTVPFDNNLAERDLRMFKLKQKISGCFRTETGAKNFCRNASFIATLKKQGQNVWKALCKLYQNKDQWAAPPE